jgi:hypothetical protein
VAVQVDWGKLVALLAIVTASTVLSVTGSMAPEATYGIIVYLAGYVTGNGRLAAKGRQPAHLLMAAPAYAVNDDEADA